MDQVIPNTGSRRKHSKRVAFKVKQVVDLYIVHKSTPQSIATMCSVSIGTVYYILRTKNIRLRGRQRKLKKRPKVKQEKYGTELLDYLYNELDLTAKEIGILFETTKRNIEKILQRRGIKKCLKSS